MTFLYNIFLWLYLSGIRIASIRNHKARQWVEGRKNWQKLLTAKWKNDEDNPVLWMHCASLGEFEQGRLIIEKLKSQHSKIKIILTFFSPSGYEIRKDYKGADVVMYLPQDSKKNAAAFLNILQPSVAIFVKYEFWHHYLAELKRRNIETYLVSGSFRKSQPFFQWWGNFHRKMLRSFTHFFVQDSAAAELLASIGLIQNVSVSGDTRFDRVIELADRWQRISSVDFFCDGFKIIVCGSTWKEDEELLKTFLNENWQNWKLIIAPHEVNETNIKRIKEHYPDSVKFSQVIHYDELSANETLKKHHVLIIDTIGHLSKLYKYGTVCYVGGGFTKSGIHNTLEAAVYSKVVITGPNIRKYHEAVEMKEAGGLFIVNDGMQMHQLINTINFLETGKKAGTFVQQHAGATVAILNYIQEKRLFTKE